MKPKQLTTYVDAMFDLLEPISSDDRALVIVVAARWLCSNEQLEKADVRVRRTISRELLRGGSDEPSKKSKKKWSPAV